MQELPTRVRGVSAKRTPRTDSTIANINATIDPRYDE